MKKSTAARPHERRDLRPNAGGLTNKELSALLKASADASDVEEALEYAQRAADLSPDDPEVQGSVQAGVFGKLRRDSYVAFVAETGRHYVVTFRNSRPVVIPKGRRALDAFPEAERTEGERALGMIAWVILGIIPAGLGAMLLSPLVASRALDVLIHQRRDPIERRRAWVVIALCAVLGCVGMVFSLLLAIHLVR